MTFNQPDGGSRRWNNASTFFRGRAFLCTAVAMLTCAGLRAGDAGSFDYRELTLDNGMRIITLEDFSCPIVAVNLWYHVGSKDEDPQRQGFAHMFEHMMFRGTDRLGPTDHFDLIRRTGGDCNAYTSFDQTVYVQTLPSNQLELALWLEAERMTFLKIDQTNFDTERKVVEEERRLGLNRPYGTMFEKLFAELFKEHPYRWTPIGVIPHLRAASVKELRDFWTRYYVPNNATLIVVGAVRHEDVQNLARKYFGWIPRYPDPPRVAAREPLPSQARSVSFKEDVAPAPLAGIVFRSVPQGHPDYHALQLLSMILGGGESSRAYRRLVAGDPQLAVMAAAAAFSLEQDGLFAAGAAMSPFGGKPDKVLSELDALLEQLRTERVTDRELLKAKNQLLKNLVTENLTIESKAAALGSAAVLEGNTANVNQRLDAIRRLTADDLLRVAKEYLAPDRALHAKVERNLLGMLFGRKKNPEDEAPITAASETDPPPPGRAGLTRPADALTSPPTAKLLDFDPTLKYESATLANGLKVIVVENHEVPFISVQLGLLHGAWSEAKPGTASMTLGMLTKGTEKHDEGQLADELETYGISLGGSADLDTASVSLSCVTDNIDRAMPLLAEVVRTPTFPESDFTKLRAQVLTGLAVSSHEPSYIADREFRRRVFGAHPYARTETGEIADVQALEIEDLRAWWDKFARPDVATLIFAGDIDKARAVALAQATLGDWKAEGARPEVRLPPIPPPAERRVYLVDRPGVQSQIRVGHLGIKRDHPAYFVSRVASQYFGGAFSSRLNETIRVKRGLTYGARGGWSASRFAGRFDVSTFSKNETTVDAVKAIFEELDRLRSEPPTDNELSSTQSYILGSFAGDRETPQAVAGQLWLLESQGLPRDYYERYLAQVRQTTGQDCLNLAAQTVDPSKAVVVVVGPAQLLEQGLSAVAPVTIVKPGPDETEPDDEQTSNGKDE
jgi:zinc protease